MDGSNSNDPIFVEDFPSPEGRIPPLRRFKWIGDNYFQTMGNPIVAGRPLNWADSYQRNMVTVVTESFAREFWKDPAAALGRRIKQSPNDPWRTIVGVAGDERDDGVARPAPAVIYWPMLLKDFWGNALVVQRTMGYAVRSQRSKSPTLIKEIQQAVWSVSASVPVANVRTLDAILATSMAQTSFALVMLGLAAGVALLLGIVGIYGVIAYVASERTREIGIRMALGATASNVLWLVLREGVVLTLSGIGVGLLLSWAIGRLLCGMLYEVSPLDPVVFAVAPLVLMVSALLASYLPARKATKVLPLTALRTE